MMDGDKWDYRFIDLARLVSSWSKDPSTKVGAVIVRPDKTIASVGFNGFAMNMRDDVAFYEQRDVKYSRIIHGEVNAVLHAREQVCGYTLYTWPFMCCDRCVVQMLQAGITRFVFPEATAQQKMRWKESFFRTLTYMDEAGVEWTQIPS